MQYPLDFLIFSVVLFVSRNGPINFSNEKRNVLCVRVSVLEFFFSLRGEKKNSPLSFKISSRYSSKFSVQSSSEKKMADSTCKFFISENSVFVQTFRRISHVLCERTPLIISFHRAAKRRNSPGIIRLSIPSNEMKSLVMKSLVIFFQRLSLKKLVKRFNLVQN